MKASLLPLVISHCPSCVYEAVTERPKRKSNTMEDKKKYDPGDRTLEFVNKQDDISKVS